MPLFECPPERREGLEMVKQAMKIRHNYLDGWIYLFYENKKFDTQETIAKLERRDQMEKTVFAQYVITPALKMSMRAGIVQYVGRDKAGRPVLYFNTARDSPKADQRPERQANMDMFLSWAVRCDPANPTATVTWLINQENASLMSNTDLIFQKDMALRISKFFPGVVAKMYICNMGSALTFVMKPLLKQLPKAISECIFLYSAGDIRRGKLLEVVDASVLPVALGGNNDIDHQDNYELFATTIESYFGRCQQALQQGLSIKEMEMMEAYPVDKEGRPLRAGSEAQPPPLCVSSPQGTRDAGGQPSFVLRAHRIEQAAEETLDLASPVAQQPSRIRVDRDGKEAIVVMSSSLRQERKAAAAAKATTAALLCRADEDLEADMSDASAADLSSPNAEHMPGYFLAPLDGPECGPPIKKTMTFFHSGSQADLASSAANTTSGAKAVTGAGAPSSSMAGAEGANGLDTYGLPVLHIDTIEHFSFAPNLPSMRLSQDKVCSLQRDWTQFLCHCVNLLPELMAVMAALRDDDVAAADVQRLNDNIPLLRRVMHHTLDLFPQTTEPLFYPLFHWLTRGICLRHNVTSDDVADRVTLDCTSPDNLLLAVQGAAVAYVDECELLLEEDRMKDRILRRAGLSWPYNVPHEAVVANLQAKTRDIWRQLVPTFHRYVESKVAMSIGDFIDHYGLLASGGKIDTRAAWYSTLFAGLVQYRELHRKNWLFFVFPPLFLESGSRDAPPTMAEMLRAQKCAPGLAAASEFLLLVERSVSGTREQLGPSSVARVSSHAAVEKYMEETGTKVYIPYEAQLTGVRPRDLIAAERENARRLLEGLGQPLRELLFLSAILLVLSGGEEGEKRAERGGASAAPPTRDATLQQVALQRRQCEDMMESRRTARQIAISVAKAAYEVQGTFGTDALGALVVSGSSTSSSNGDAATSTAPARPDGYAIGFSLLLLEALVACRLPRAQSQAPPPTLANESFVISMRGGGSGSGVRGAAATPRYSPVDHTGLPGGSVANCSDGDDEEDLHSMHSARSEGPVDVDDFMRTIVAMDEAAASLVTAKRLLVR